MGPLCRRSRGRVVLLALLAAAVTACGSSEASFQAPKAFCRAGRAYEQELQREDKQGGPDLERQLPLVRELAARAPKAIARPAQAFLDAMERAGSDAKAVDDPAVRKAVDAVNRYYGQGCGVYARQGF